MTIALLKLKALAEAAKRDPYDNLAANDYGMSMPPAMALELIAEIERHREVNAEGYKPESSILLAGLPYAGAMPCRNLNEVEGCKPDYNGIAARQLHGGWINICESLPDQIEQTLPEPPIDQQAVPDCTIQSPQQQRSRS